MTIPRTTTRTTARRAALLRCLKTAAAPLLLGGLLTSCASLIGPRQVELPLERLQQSLDKRFPISQRELAIFDVQLSRPLLTILHDSERVALSAELSVSPLLLRQSWRGQFALSGRLVVDGARNAVFLSEAQVDRFALDGVGETQQRQIAAVATMLTDKLMRDVPVYAFRPEDLRYAGVQFVPTAIRTTPRGLAVTLEPVK